MIQGIFWVRATLAKPFREPLGTLLMVAEISYCVLKEMQYIFQVP